MERARQWRRQPRQGGKGSELRRRFYLVDGDLADDGRAVLGAEGLDLGLVGWDQLRETLLETTGLWEWNCDEAYGELSLSLSTSLPPPPPLSPPDIKITRCGERVPCAATLPPFSNARLRTEDGSRSGRSLRGGQ